MEPPDLMNDGGNQSKCGKRTTRDTTWATSQRIQDVTKTAIRVEIPGEATGRGPKATPAYQKEGVIATEKIKSTVVGRRKRIMQESKRANPTHSGWRVKGIAGVLTPRQFRLETANNGGNGAERGIRVPSLKNGAAKEKNRLRKNLHQFRSNMD